MTRPTRNVPIFVGLLAIGFAPLALTQSPQGPDSLDQAAMPRSQIEAADADDAKEIQCVRETGTRLASKARRNDPKACQPGRAFDRDDIDRTGATSVADAINRLDPAVRIRRR